MLLSILNGDLSTSFVCIEDCFEQSGHHFLKVCAQQAVNKKGNQVHIFCYELPIRKLEHGLKNIDIDHVHIHDCFTDHRGWNDDLNKENHEKTNSGILPVLQRLSSTDTKNCIVVIDSLTPLIYNIGFTRCYRDLHSLLLGVVNGLQVSQIICLIHGDTVPDAHIVLPQIQHLATSYIKIKAPNKSSGGKPIATITHKKPGGNIVKEMECYFIDEENKVQSEVLRPCAESNRQISEDADLPQNLTTFKLSLEQQEKQARSQLVLPYLRASKVFYQPDAADDWDEEDPDDDLDV